MMKNEKDRIGHPEAISENLSFETLDAITGGSVKSEYWEKLVSDCQTSDDAFSTLVRDTNQGKISILIADILVKDIEPYYEKKKK
ncbi:hypothetical protein [Noviherbaspirillum soli]|uniref:hypothetical protein n=1 Tax=Noviherbaspirillum soli TaxID=1064518 RepID=UPI00188D3D94|nr:hypothetical protein [Noviherbaspirillum soli]